MSLADRLIEVVNADTTLSVERRALLSELVARVAEVVHQNYCVKGVNQEVQWDIAAIEKGEDLMRCIDK